MAQTDQRRTARDNDRTAPSRRGRWTLIIIGVVVIVVGAVFLLLSGPPEQAVAPVESAAAGPLEPPTLRSAAGGRAIYVAPDGLASNPGTDAAPVDLATALSSNSPASPGDTIWLRSGTYTGNFTSTLLGTEAAPIQVRQRPGERATIAAAKRAEPALSVAGGWTWFRDFEITAAADAADEGTAVDLRQSAGVVVHGDNLAFLNLIVHQMPQGINVMAGATGTLLYGNIVYRSGWDAPSPSVGIKAGSNSERLYVVDNIVFEQGAGGVSVSMGPADRLLLEGNIVFNNGVAGDFFDRNLLVEGGSMVIARNYTYYRAGRRGGDNNFGYSAGCVKMEAEGNYWAHPEAYPFSLAKCPGMLTGNTLIGAVDPPVANQFVKNTYIRSKPTGLATFVRPDRYSESRIQIVVFNWDKYPAVNVDMAGAELAAGTAYEIRDVQNYFGDPVATGVYSGGRLNIPMTGLRSGAAPGRLPPGAGHSAPEFGAFILVTSPASR